MAIAHDELALMNALRPAQPKPRTWIEDIEVRYDGRSRFFSVQVEHKTDEDGNVIAGTMYYDGKPISSIPVIVELIELALQSDQV